MLKMGKTPNFTCSFGIPDSSMPRQPDQLIRLADRALYQAKAQGRDRACIADGSIAQEGPHARTAEAKGAGMDLHSMAAEEA